MKKLYSGIIHLFDALAPKSEEEKSESIANATELLESFKLNNDGIAKEASVTAAPKAGSLPLPLRADRVAKMKLAPHAESNLDGIDGTAVEVEVIEAVTANTELMDVLQGLNIGNVARGEAKSAITEETHAAAAKEEKEKDKASKADGRAG